MPDCQQNKGKRMKNVGVEKEREEDASSGSHWHFVHPWATQSSRHSLLVSALDPSSPSALIFFSRTSSTSSTSDRPVPE